MIRTSEKWIKFDQTVHYDIAGRKRYKRKMLCLFTILIVILLGCSAMFYFGNTDWDPEAGFAPAAKPDTWWKILLVVFASIISFFSMVGYCVYCCIDINKFYKTQQEYWKTKQFQHHKARALKKDLTKLDNKTLKWYKKLGYLTSQERREVLEKKKNKKTTKN